MSVTIDERTNNGMYCDVLAAIEYYRTRFGTSPNAAVQMLRDSPLYLEAKKAIGKDFPKAGTTPGKPGPKRQGDRR